MRSELPYIDEHAITIAAPRDLVWNALRRYVETAVLKPDGDLLRRLLGTEPRGGFAVAESVAAQRLSLVGRHRFAHYNLAFELADAPDGATQLRARSYGAFPGIHGRLYRALVVGTRAHVVATRRMLHAVRRLSLELQASAPPTAR